MQKPLGISAGIENLWIRHWTYRIPNSGRGL